LKRDKETLLLVKTTGVRFEALRARLCELYPYELPEIIAIPVIQGLPDYLWWIDRCTASDA